LTEGYLFGYLPSDNQYLIGLRPAASVIILFLVLLVLPNPRLRTHGRLREFFPAPSMQGALLFAGIVLAGGVVMATTLDSVDAITYGQIFSIGIIALSFVPLLGLAGQISLAQLGFAGIGAVVMAHHGAGGNPLGVVLAVVVSAAVGALVALPVLRLSGIYLALATAAFAVALDRWIFNLPDFDIGPVHISIFTRGSVDVAPLKLFGYTFDSPARQLLLANVVFVAVAMLVVAVRRSGFGRRLLAIRDSEAACATFGLNLVGTRLAVFTLSAGIAGLGGAVYATQLNSINPTRFDVVVGLPIFMLVVVGGAGLVGGALFAGASLNGLLPLVATLGNTAARWSTMAPGLVGIGLGRNPSGAVQDMGEGVLPLRRDHTVLAGMFAAMALSYALRLLDVITNWPFVILLALSFVAANVAAMLRARLAAGAVEPEPDLEWVGITSPWTPERVAAIDRALALDEVRVRAPA
jgi:branched-chain amino acid transport system permease protein